MTESVSNIVDNAAARKSFASDIYARGVERAKAEALAQLPAELAKLHEDGAIHIHDLEAFGKVYNCCTPRLARYLEAREVSSASDAGKIHELLDSVKALVCELALAQSGGIGFGNFDIDLGAALESTGVQCAEGNEEILLDAMRSFVRWVNTTHTRFCREPYYLTFNIGLGTGRWARVVSRALLNAFHASPAAFTRPNIVFKVSGEVNAHSGSPNHDLYRLALSCTAKRMVPTYLLMDSPVNEGCDPLRLNIMGCRTRVYANAAGEPGTVGRGNVGCVSVNLPRIVLEEGDADGFYATLRSRVVAGCEILEMRRKALLSGGGEHLGFVLGNHLWDASSVEELAEQGTYSVGFIGLAETVEILFGGEGASEARRQEEGLRIVSFMADIIEEKRAREQRNYSLLASPGEMISGRFCDADRERYPHPVQEKGYYTNSFHVPVSAGLPLFEKVEREAPFHALCGGGSISYVEFPSAILENVEAIDDAVRFAASRGVSYIGFNFPLDTCRKCGYTGTFDACDRCGSDDILRIRRVSGYLEDLSHFTKGKKAEAGERAANPLRSAPESAEMKTAN